MALLVLRGPHAIGKTTAVRAVLAMLRNATLPVTVMFADTCTECYYDESSSLVEVKTPALQGTAAEKSEILKDCIADNSWIYIHESARSDGSKAIVDAYVRYGGGVYLVFATCHPQVMRQQVMDRCAKVGKEFRNRQNWDYESKRRFHNQIRNHFKPVGVPCYPFNVSYDRHEWEDILEKMWELVNIPPKDWYKPGVLL